MRPARKGRPGQATSAPARVLFASSATSCALSPGQVGGQLACGGKHAWRAQRDKRRGTCARD
jgi:hypothetical protein